MKLLAKTDLTLANVIHLCETVETVNKQVAVFNKEHINVIYKKKDFIKKQKNISKYNNKNEEKYKCKYCGGTHERRQCPTYNKTCHECGKKTTMQKCATLKI